jgi:hypothetical protein
MKTKIEINSVWGSVIFEYEKENNSISETVKEYIRKELSSGKDYANLSFANLSFANLSSVDLSSVDLSFANLSFANLSFANLSFANLYSANLSFADLSFANLRSIDLRFANLSSVENLIYSACYFLGYNKIGHQLLAVKTDDDIELYYEYFKGNKKEFMVYIEEREDKKLKSSILIALDTVIKLIEIKE